MIEKLDWAERWFHDAFRVIAPPGGFATQDIDMTRAAQLVEKLRGQGLRVSFNHLVVRAVALALAQHPEWHVLVAGNRRLRPAQVDIGLSVAGTTAYAPVMVLQNVAAKPLTELSQEIVRRIPEVQAKEAQDLRWMRRWGRLVPFAWLRRALLRFFLRRVSFRRKLSGTFQVSCLNVDIMVPFLFNSAAMLGVGRVRERPAAVEGKVVVRPLLTVACTVDHAAWSGARAADFLQEVKKLIESSDLDA